MDSIDVLGERPERHAAFTGELLTEANDRELQEIVRKAAKELGTPIALVSLVLDQIQFFKAQYGLPEDLAKSRGTPRNVSFCQFVVRDGKPFEVNDARHDSRIPQHLVKEYNIQAYLGMPIQVRGTTVGSLCVIDTKKREFSASEHESLARLAESVNERIEKLYHRRRQARIGLAERSLGPVVAQASRSLVLIQHDVESALQSIPAIRSFLNLSNHILDGGSSPPSTVKRSLAAAIEALGQNEDTLFDIVASAGDCNDCLVAIDNLVTPSESTRVSELMTSAQDLARYATEEIGGMPLPDLDVDPTININRPFAVALLTTVILSVAEKIKSLDGKSGIKLMVQVGDEYSGFDLSSDDLSPKDIKDIVNDLEDSIGEDPAVRLLSKEKSVQILLKSQRDNLV